MNRNARRAALALVVVAASALHPARAQEQKMPDAAQMQAMMEKMGPGPEHEALSYFVGDWSTTIVASTPAGETKSTGSARYEMVLGGRYLRGTHAGDMMGMPLEGLTIDGYDRMVGRHFSMWMSNMGTSCMTSWGAPSGENEVVLEGTHVDGMSGMEVEHRLVRTIVGDDAFTLEMFMNPGGQEMKVMEVAYQRR